MGNQTKRILGRGRAESEELTTDVEKSKMGMPY